MDENAAPLRAKGIGESIARARRRRGLTLDRLAELSLISRAAISALEKGGGNPRVQTLWSLADALGVNFGTLLGDNGGEAVYEEDGIGVRLLERQNSPKIVEVFLLDLPGGKARQAKAHITGVREHVVVLAGEMQVGAWDSPALLRPGHSTSFLADVPHIYAAGHERSRAVVTVVYPETAARTVPDHDLPWPTTEADWDMVSTILSRSMIEVQNGLDVSVTSFRSAVGRNPAKYAGELRDRLASVPTSPAIRRFACAEEEVMVVSLYRATQMQDFGPLPETLESDLARRCWRLAAAACRKRVSDGEHEDLLYRASQPGAVIETALAAEVLTRIGCPTVPYGVGLSSAAASSSDADRRLFEARIDVDAYEAYELVHPAYARQALAVAAALPWHRNLKIIDIGTGPGLPLAMLRELRADLRAVAVDPSDVAVGHLSQRFRNDPAIEIIKKSITELDPPETPYSCAVSIGASHHLDTAAFLSGIHRQLAAGGRLIVADEMLSPYITLEERQAALIRHHLWYILDTLVLLPDTAHKGDIDLAERLALTLPRASAMAHAGKTSAAIRLIRETYESVMQIERPPQPSDALAVFSRFHLLELQALIAGFDYEVEQKTYPERFMSIAETCGFKNIRHERIYATSGDKSCDAGTHLFIFEAT